LVADEHYWSLNELIQHVARALDVRVRIRHLPYWPLWAAAWVCELACKPLRIAPPIFPRRVAWFRQDRAFSIEKARRQLGYQPRVGIEQGMSATAEWYQRHNHL
jgi:nucleoside-diphosphate-sugar epimerase